MEHFTISPDAPHMRKEYGGCVGVGDGESVLQGRRICEGEEGLSAFKR